MILENPPPFAVQIVGKMPKAHEKGIVNLQFVYNGMQVALCSVGHDSIKMWTLNDMEEDNIVVFTQMNEFIEWRCGVQTAHTLPNASCTGVVGADSMIYSLEADDDGSHIRAYDMGYMEVWHIVVVEPGRFITTSFSGFLSEVVDGKFGIREPYPKIKSIICMNLSPSGKLLAMGGAEGSVDIVDAKTLKVIHSFEAHWTRITSILFLSDDCLLTGGFDKYIKYFKLLGTTHSLEKTLCGHRGAITCIVPAPSIEDTKRFASASVNGQVILWDLESSSPLTHIEVPHEGTISALAFSPCGQFLVSGGDDKLLALYRVAADPLYENVPLLNSGVELMKEMREMQEMNDMNGGKENEEPIQRRDQFMREDSEEEMELDNGGDATKRDLFGDSSDSDEGENRREMEDEEREEIIERDEREERSEEEDERREGNGDMIVNGGGGYEGYGREDDGEREEGMEEGGGEERGDEREEYREEEREEDREEEREEGREEDREEDEERGEEGGYEEEERREDEQEDVRREEEAERSGGEEEEDHREGYIPSKVKKEEPIYGGYGDSPRREDNPTTPPYEEE